MKLNFHFLPLTVRLVSYTPGRNSLPVERSFGAPETAIRERVDRARFAGQTNRIMRMPEAKILRKSSDTNETRPIGSMTVDFGMNSGEKSLLEEFFKLLDMWDSEDSSENANPS